MTRFAFTDKHRSDAASAAVRLSDILGEALDIAGDRDLSQAERIVWEGFVAARTKLDIVARNLGAIQHQQEADRCES